MPLIAIALTGGLWFGVASLAESSERSFRRPGLLLADVRDLLRIAILERLCNVVGGYLDWLAIAYPRGFVAADGDGWWSRKVAKRCFQIMRGFAAAASFVLSGGMMTAKLAEPVGTKPRPSTAWYDAHAHELADGYEGLDAAVTHPRLFELLRDAHGARILDVGAGTGRDAAALSERGHRVTAVEPSTAMLRLARALHPGNDVRWLSDAMPTLGKVQGAFDFVVLSAVWMHVPPADRADAFSRLADLLAPQGHIYMTLRFGPGGEERSMWSVDASEIERLAGTRGLKIADHGSQTDLLGRDDVSWQTLVISRD